jgi:hypothetical protein
MSLPFSLCGEGGVNFANVETIFNIGACFKPLRPLWV